jgi:protein TonB
MTTRREPTSQRDDAPLRVVGHRLQQVDASAHAASSPNGQLRSPARSPNRPVASSRATPDQSAIRRQVVLVDREIDALRDVAIALRDEYDFHITISGAEALNLLRDGAIDTIVVGQTLYSSTGLNVLAEARRHAPHTHRILLANAVEAGAVERGSLAVAPFKVMQRPCTADKLRELLEANAISDEVPDTLAEQVPPIASTSRIHGARFDDTRADSARSDRDRHDPANFEHVVMETAPERPSARRKASAKDAASGADSLPIIVYTDNAEFYHSLTLALQDRHDLRLCTQLERAAELAEMGLCPLLITDRAGTQVELQRISIALRAQDAGMLTIAVGTPEVGAAMRKLLGTAVLHSFLAKPLNASLVRLAVESAKRQYLQAQTLKHSHPELLPSPPAAQAKTKPAPAAPVYVPGYRSDFSVDDYDESPWRRAAPKLAIATALILAAAGGGVYWWQASERSADAASVVANDLSLAQRALDAGRYATPSNDSALYYYDRVLKQAPNNQVAITGMERTVERVIEQAEQALINEQLDAAAESIATVRTLQPNNKRLPFLESQLDKERRQLAARSQTRNATAAASAAALASDANSAAPISNESQRQQLISRWLASARQRLTQDRLLTPENDSAEFYFRQVERADPGNAKMQQGLREIGARLLTSARDALSRQQLELARRHASDALRFGADSAAVENLRLEIDAAATATTRSNYLRLSLQRTRDNKLFEPDRDSAKFYLGQLQQLAPSSPETEQALRALALKLIENADQALAHQQMNTAVQLLNETRRLGFSGNELAAAEARVRAARTPPRATPATQNTVAAAPKAIKVVPPRFPEEAMRAGAQGWVDVGFKITASGDVTDAAAVANNQGQFSAQFERAAVAAIRQYKFEPRNLSENQTQSMVVRVQFKLQ